MKASNTSSLKSETGITPLGTNQSDVRAVLQASLLGGGIALLGFLALISRGFTTFSATSFGSNFYDVQAHSMLHGRFNVPANVAKIEGLLVHGKTYIYFGPFLSVLRMPFVLLAPSTSGHLTQASMTVAFCLLLAAAAWLSWLGRLFVAGSASLTRRTLLGQALFVMLAGLGSVAFYLAGSPTVYYETELWGAALSLWCVVAFIRFVTTRRTGWLLLLALSTLCVGLTRTSLAMGMIVLLLLAAGVTARGVVAARRSSQNTSSSLRLFALSCGSLFVILIAMTGVNYAKFKTLFSIPFTTQFAVRAHFPQSLWEFFQHHSSVLGLRYLPTTLAWYLNPAAFHVSPLFPFFNYTRSIHVVGGVQFAWLQPSSSVTDTMPLLLGLAVIGFITLLRRSALSTHTELALAFRLAALGSLVGAGGALLFTGIANRYMADFLPLLFLGAGLGFHLFGRWVDTIKRPLALSGLVALSALGLWSFYANASLGTLDAFSFRTNTQGTSGASFLSLQLKLSHLLTLNKPIPFDTGSMAPRSPQYGELFIQNHCDALFSYQFAGWGPIEVGQQGGRFSLNVSMPSAAPSGVEPLLVSGDTPSHYEWWGIRFLPGHRFVLRWTTVIPNGPTPAGPPSESAPQPYIPGHTLPLELTIAVTGPPESTLALAQVNSREVLRESLFWVHAVAPGHALWTLGRFPSGPTTTFHGTLTQIPVSTPLCTELLHQR